VISASVPNFIEIQNTWCNPFAHLAWNDAEDLIQSVNIEDHTSGPRNQREHFPEEELTLDKNRLIEVDK